jgi:hypothetical protein
MMLNNIFDPDGKVAIVTDGNGALQKALAAATATSPPPPAIVKRPRRHLLIQPAHGAGSFVSATFAVTCGCP